MNYVERINEFLGYKRFHGCIVAEDVVSAKEVEKLIEDDRICLICMKPSQKIYDAYKNRMFRAYEISILKKMPKCRILTYIREGMLKIPSTDLLCRVWDLMPGDVIETDEWDPRVVV